MGETEGKIHISGACRNAIIRQGVLMKDLPDGTRVPAAMDLMNKPVLRIALVEAGEDSEFPDGFVNDDLRAFLGDYEEPLVLNGPYHFPEGMQDIVRESLGFWYDGQINFVSLNDNPDIQIFAFATDDALPMIPRGMASPPKGNSDTAHSRSYDGEQVYIGLNIGFFEIDAPLENLTLASYTKDILTHEFGHPFGIKHPNDAIEAVLAAKNSQCTEDETREYRFNEIAGAHMGLGQHHEGERHPTDYDRGTKEFVETGILPKPGGGTGP